MRLRYHSILSLWLVLNLHAPSAVAEDGPTSLWDLNQSVLALYKNGAERTFRYHEPRAALQQEGVTAGTVWFDGTLTGNTYTGTAYVFHRRCGPQPFPVEGTLDDDERRIAFTGAQPMAFDARCKATAIEDVEFEITFVRSLAPPPPLVYGSIDRAPAASSPEQPALYAMLAERALAEQRLRDLRTETDRNEQRLRDQRQEAERIAGQRQHEEQRLAELRTFAGQRDACRQYDAGACDAALRSSHATTQDAIELLNWRNVVRKLDADQDACRSGSISACDAAAASPALEEMQRRDLEAWRAAALPFNRVKLWLSEIAATFTTTADDVVTAAQELPASTQVTGGLAAALALALAAVTLRRRPPRTSNAQALPPEIKQEAVAPAEIQARTPPPPKVATSPPNRPATSQPEQAELAAPQRPRDTPAAIAALELAHAYIEEVREAERPGLEDDEVRREHLNTLALAAKQLEAADRFDPDAMLEGQDEKDVPYRFTINELKSDALFLEGLTHQTYDVKRAIPALGQATVLDPNNPNAFYVLGLTHLANMNKGAAIAALERAVELDPKTIAYRKELDRAQNLSGGTVVAYKATRAGEKIFDAGVKTANAGIAVYNVGVVTWNVFAFTWNVLTFPLRMVFKIFGLFDRISGAR